MGHVAAAVVIVERRLPVLVRKRSAVAEEVVREGLRVAPGVDFLEAAAIGVIGVRRDVAVRVSDRVEQVVERRVVVVGVAGHGLRRLRRRRSDRIEPPGGIVTVDPGPAGEVRDRGDVVARVSELQPAGYVVDVVGLGVDVKGLVVLEQIADLDDLAVGGAAFDVHAVAVAVADFGDVGRAVD